MCKLVPNPPVREPEKPSICESEKPPIREPEIVCDRGRGGLVAIEIKERVALLVVVDEHGTECEVELPRSCGLLLYLLAKAWEQDGPAVRHAWRGARRAGVLAERYCSLKGTSSSTDEHFIRRLVLRLRGAVRGAAEKKSAELGRAYVPLPVIETTRSGYCLGSGGLALFGTRELE